SHLVHRASQLRQMLTYANIRRAGRNRYKLAANFGRSVGLGIERIEMARPAVIENEDARADRFRSRGRRRRSGPRLQEARQIQRRRTEGRRLQELSAADSIASIARRWLTRHDLFPLAIGGVATLLKHLRQPVHRL